MNLLPAEFHKLPLIGILRDLDERHLEPLIDTVVSSGLKTIEFTMNSPGADHLIRRAVDLAGSRLWLGAGTVMNRDDLDRALQAGARFIVSPVLVREVVASCREKAIPVFPGALTPQEIYEAWSAGATMVKVFPSKFFGPDYFREIKGPFRDIRLLACGGLTPENVKQYLAAGASALACGSGIFHPGLMADGRFPVIGEKLRRLVAALSEVVQA